MLHGVVQLKIFAFHVDQPVIKLGFQMDLKTIVLLGLAIVLTILVDAVALPLA